MRNKSRGDEVSPPKQKWRLAVRMAELSRTPTAKHWDMKPYCSPSRPCHVHLTCPAAPISTTTFFSVTDNVNYQYRVQRYNNLSWHHSRNHRIAGAGSDLKRSPSPTTVWQEAVAGAKPSFCFPTDCQSWNLAVLSPAVYKQTAPTFGVNSSMHSVTYSAE